MIRHPQAFRINLIRSAQAQAVLLALTLGLCSQASALQGTARIAGAVKDQAGAPVSSAEVVLTTKTGSNKQITDSEGRFAFDSVQGESGTIIVRATGFDSAERRWNAADRASTLLDIVLVPAPLSSEMTVTAARTATRVSDTAASVAVLSSEDLATTAALTVDDALRQVPGFSLLRRSGSRTANPTSQGVSFRGVGPSGASRAVVLADGIPINDPFGGWVYWGRVPREAINRIEVVQGGASSLYGTDALGGGDQPDQS